MKWGPAACLVVLLLAAGCNEISRAVPSSQLLPEAYIWFGGASADASSPRYFRRSFQLESPPQQATLYFVGPYNSDIFLNGSLISHMQLGGPGLVPDRPVSILDVSDNLLAGRNTIGIEASAGEIFAMKIVPAAEAIDSPALVFSDASWKAATSAPGGWELPSFDDASWSRAQTFGSIESDPHHFQGNFDLGMYRWPGYQGINAILDHEILEPVSIVSPDSQTLLLDFGEEIAGRLEVASSSTETVQLQLNLGESEEEATPQLSYLGTRDLIVPPLSTVHGPTSAFRFAQVAFTGPPTTAQSLQIRADRVLRNFSQTGSFESSDPVINKIWNTSVYTAQLGLQTTVWDAPKRDRNPFSGDLFVIGRTAQVAFGPASAPLVRETLAELLQRICAVEAVEIFGQDINCIPSYNAWWVIALADLYRADGDISMLRENRDNLIQVLTVMQNELSRGLFQATDPSATIFADWSPGMIQFGTVGAPEAVKITTFVYFYGFSEAAFLFEAMGDRKQAATYREIAGGIKSAAIAAYLDSATETFGDRVQTNAMAVFSGVADPSTISRIFEQILNQPPAQPVTPYFNYFVAEAIAQAGHRAEALTFIRQFWGTMLDTGATTFWEIYDPRCVARVDFHSCLVSFINSIAPQGSTRDFVSLAHGWASGPAVWLQEEVLGIRPLVAGFRMILIRPDLSGLQWARGKEATPFGPVSVDILDADHCRVDIPEGSEAVVSLPTPSASPRLHVNNAEFSGRLAEGGTRTVVHLPSGHFDLQTF